MEKRRIMLAGGLATGIASALAVNPLAQGLVASPLAAASPVAATTAATKEAAAASTSASAASPAASASRTLTGSAYSMQYGTVQVALTMSGSTITDVQVLQAPGGRNQQFTDYAVPILTQEVLQAQSANVATVSGATFVSEAFLASVQSALAQR